MEENMAEEATQEADPQETYEQSDSAPQEDDGLKRALAAERKARTAAEKQAKELRAQLSEFEPKEKQFTERLTALETELKNERLTLLKTKVSADKGVPVSALVGETQEELEAFADQLLEWRGAQPKAKPTTGLKSGASSTESRLDPMERAAAAVRQLRNR
jgi:metal-responsive CopG/Arc/MetJ family transcriptional regulator